MGLAYKAFQSLAYFGLEWGRDIGKEIEKERERERLNKKYKDDRSIVDYEGLDRYWDNMLQDCWDNGPYVFGKKDSRKEDVL